MMESEIVAFKVAMNGVVVVLAAFIAQATVLGDAELRAWVIIGAIAGGTLAIAVNRPRGWREASVKMFCSALASFVVAPWFLLKFCSSEGAVVVELAVFVAFVIGFLAWILLKGLQEVARKFKWAELVPKSWRRFFLNGNDDEQSD